MFDSNTEAKCDMCGASEVSCTAGKDNTKLCSSCANVVVKGIQSVLKTVGAIGVVADRIAYSMIANMEISHLKDDSVGAIIEVEAPVRKRPASRFYSQSAARSMRVSKSVPPLHPGTNIANKPASKPVKIKIDDEMAARRELNQRLQEAIGREDYELAAAIRDEINKK